MANPPDERSPGCLAGTGASKSQLRQQQRPPCSKFRPAPQPPHRRARRPEAAQARLQEHVEHLAWLAYVRTLALQEAEPGPITNIIRNSVYTAWARAFLAQASS